MKKTQFLKAFALSLATAFVMLLPTSMNAQNDGFFLNNEDIYASRNSIGFNIFVGQFGGDGGQAGGNYGIGIGTFGQDPPAPLGSGLFIMAAAGAAYAFSKKRKKQENN